MPRFRKTKIRTFPGFGTDMKERYSMIRCEERDELQTEFEKAVVTALTEDARLKFIKLPNDEVLRQLERTAEADRKEEDARTAYTQHIKIHRCLS
jgi:hypothetical protein